MRKVIIAGNWKMNLGLKQARELAEGISSGLSQASPDREIMVFPSAVHIPVVADILKDTRVILGAQNIYPSAPAAFTGENSVEQMRDFGVTHILIGHSERRQFIKETDAFLNQKVHFVLEHQMIPVLCIGETLEERESNKTLEVIKTQLLGGLKDVNKGNVSKIILAYEPVWAIGTGKVATPEQAQEVHLAIRKELEGLYGSQISDSISILYGGSVKPDNIKSLLDMPDIDGALVGGASQKADSYMALL
ncbi:MAG: triose-phosphate isomerase [Leptospiraceae bacterium]|nr:triose-phosphate isomerase [Leptospiraceae bacterium]